MTGRSPSELARTWTARDLAELIEFERLYDLPDGFFVAKHQAAALRRFIGGSDGPAHEFVPYYLALAADLEAEADAPDPDESARNLALALAPIRARPPCASANSPSGSEPTPAG